jgi:hypothetical protein
MAALVLHINREALHHGAEIALLRDLYRWGGHEGDEALGPASTIESRGRASGTAGPRHGLVPPDGHDPDVRAGVRRLDHQAATDVHADVMDG